MMAPDDLRRLAATFVLGTLDGEEREQARARRGEDADFAALVRLWEDRLAPLHVLSPAVRPPPGLWEDLLAALPVPAPETEPGGETDPSGETEPGGDAPSHPPGDAPKGADEAAANALAAHSFPLGAGDVVSPDGGREAEGAGRGTVLSPEGPSHPPAVPSLDAPMAAHVTPRDPPSQDPPSQDPPSQHAPPETASAPSVQPEPADASARVPPHGEALPAADAVLPEIGPVQDLAGASPAQAPAGDASGLRSPEETAAAPVAVGPEAAPDSQSEPQPDPQSAASSPAGEGTAREAFDPAQSKEAGLGAPASVSASQEVAPTPEAPREPADEPRAPAQEGPPPVAPRGPFDIVLDRPAPTGREASVLPRGETGAETGNPWRLTTGLLLLAGLIGGAAVAYRETHRQLPPPDVFAPLKSSPYPQMVLALDPEAGDVVVRQLDEAPPAGMVYRMWLVSHTHGTSALCTFTAVGRCPAGALGAVDRAGLMAGVLQVTLEPAGLSLSTPTGKVVYHGRALTR